MHHVLVFGAGKIGSLISFLLCNSKQYHVHLADHFHHTDVLKKLEGFENFSKVPMDAGDKVALEKFLSNHREINTIISSLPFYCNVPLAEVAAKFNLNYFDLTEDVETTKAVTHLALNTQSSFVPQCGLAPGFISIVANQLMKKFDTLETVKMRVGALPAHTSNALHYALTWSTDGLINEYGNPCYVIKNGEEIAAEPLEGLEQINLDGLPYEAFNTSGGIGSLAHTYHGKVKNLNYKTIRYPGHAEKIKFLMNDLKLNDDRETLKKIFEQAIPRTFTDMVLVYVSVTGMQNDQYLEENYMKKFYPQTIGGHLWSAIQLTTACGICSVVDLVQNSKNPIHGLINQEKFSLDDLIQNPFGKYFAS